MTGGPSAGEPRVVVLPDADAVSSAAADHVADVLIRAAGERGRADWATTGGSGALGLYRGLAEGERRARIPWPLVHLWWGDDRYVPRDHKLSNVMPADQALLNTAALSGQSGWGEEARDVRRGIDAGAPIPPTQIHPIPAAEAIGRAAGTDWAAAQYEQELRASGIEVDEGWPVFDLVVLGVGPDGHILSVFPDSPALAEPRAWALGVPAPTHVEPHVERITLNPAILGVARDVLVVAHGESKAEVLGLVFGAQRDSRRWPAQLARVPSATWLLDEAAAAGLPPEVRR